MSKRDILRFVPYELRKDEGVRNRKYNCSAGKTTIGIGFNIHTPGLCVHPDLEPYARGERDFMFEDDMELILRDILDVLYDEMHGIIVSWGTLETGRQASLINMYYQLGYKKFCGFKKMIAAVNDRRWEDAQKEAKDSLWFKQTQKSRTDRVIEGLAP